MSNVEKKYRVVEEDIGPLRIVTRQEQPPVLSLEGRVNSDNAYLLEDELKHQSNLGEHDVVVNLEQTVSISSAGLRALIAGLRENRKHRGGLLLENPSEGADKVLEATGLDSIFAIRRPEGGGLDK